MCHNTAGHPSRYGRKDWSVFAAFIRGLRWGSGGQLADPVARGMAAFFVDDNPERFNEDKFLRSTGLEASEDFPRPLGATPQTYAQAIGLDAAAPQRCPATERFGPGDVRQCTLTAHHTGGCSFEGRAALVEPSTFVPNALLARIQTVLNQLDNTTCENGYLISEAAELDAELSKLATEPMP